MAKREPILGLALPGAAARSAFYVGFLEVLQESNIKVEVIAAQSGGSIVASAFACGTLPQLKELIFSLDWKKIRSLLHRVKGEGGLYSIARAEEYMRDALTLGKRFEDIETKLVFTATNLNTGELIPLAMGDIARSIHATCAVPGIFAPVRWGNYLLVDGGLVSVMPGKLARQAGADVVIGVDAKATRYIFMSSHITLRAWYNLFRTKLRNSLLGRLGQTGRQGLSTAGVELYVEGTTVLDDEQRPARLSKVLARSLDLAHEARESSKHEDPLHGCDLIISEGPGKFADTATISLTRQTYADGRRSALENLGKIRTLLDTYRN